ncbi:MAG TPA: iron-sulfur cluster repair di-iron protein, ric [Fastidiosipila sp.]|jgi:regulator of cell morphogenesis and NO signaling|nr:iron-sulfur cluster repair di-iron protein, ric [Eubacteriales bacterium]HHU04177.1 iron-sulfur cluster repair di-iron protein, ric [Fastidiosipila sp.]
MSQSIKVQLDEIAPYVPVVDRVHGPTHPEFHEVRKLFDQLVEKTNAADGGCPEVAQEFAQLREVTNNYKVPSDVCETYEEVYQALEKLDKQYSSCPSRNS